MNALEWNVCVCESVCGECVCVSLLSHVLAATIGSAAAARSMSFLLMLRYLNYARAVKVRHWRFEHVFADTFNRKQKIETETENGKRKTETETKTENKNFSSELKTIHQSVKADALAPRIVRLSEYAIQKQT